MATRIALTGPGPFETPTIVDYLGLAYPMTTSLVQVRFALEGGTEIHLPIQGVALEKLMNQLAALHPSKKKKGFTGMMEKR
jgi:hypothetical protein